MRDQQFMIELTGFRNKQSIVLWQRKDDPNNVEYCKAINHLEYLDYIHSIKSAERIITRWFGDKEKQKYAIELNNEAVNELTDYRVMFVRIIKEIRIRIAIGEMARNKEKWLKRINESKGLIRDNDIEFMTYLLEETNTYNYSGFQNSTKVRSNGNAPNSFAFKTDRPWVTIRNITEVIKQTSPNNFMRLPKYEEDDCRKVICNLAEAYWRTGINFIYSGNVNEAINAIDDYLKDECIFLYDKIGKWEEEAARNASGGFSPDLYTYMGTFAQLVTYYIKKFNPNQEEFDAVQELGIT